MRPLRLVFSFDHLTSALFGPSTSLNGPSLADPRCHRFSALDHTQTLLPLPLLPFQNPPALPPLLPFQNPPALLRARSLLGLRIRHTQTLLPLALLPFQNPPGLPRARNLLDLRIRSGSTLMSGSSQWMPWPPPCSHLVLYVQALFCAI